MNANSVGNDLAGGSRTTALNAFVLDNVDETILVNGAVYSQQTLVPPPDLTTRSAQPAGGRQR